MGKRPWGGGYLEMIMSPLSPEESPGGESGLLPGVDAANGAVGGALNGAESGAGSNPISAWIERYGWRSREKERTNSKFKSSSDSRRARLDSVAASLRPAVPPPIEAAASKNSNISDGSCKSTTVKAGPSKPTIATPVPVPKAIRTSITSPSIISNSPIRRQGFLDPNSGSPKRYVSKPKAITSATTIGDLLANGSAQLVPPMDFNLKLRGPPAKSKGSTTSKESITQTPMSSSRMSSSRPRFCAGGSNGGSNGGSKESVISNSTHISSSRPRFQPGSKESITSNSTPLGSARPRFHADSESNVPSKESVISSNSTAPSSARPRFQPAARARFNSAASLKTGKLNFKLKFAVPRKPVRQAVPPVKGKFSAIPAVPLVPAVGPAVKQLQAGKFGTCFQRLKASARALSNQKRQAKNGLKVKAKQGPVKQGSAAVVALHGKTLVTGEGLEWNDDDVINKSRAAPGANSNVNNHNVEDTGMSNTLTKIVDSEDAENVADSTNSKQISYTLPKTRIITNWKAEKPKITDLLVPVKTPSEMGNSEVIWGSPTSKKHGVPQKFTIGGGPTYYRSEKRRAHAPLRITSLVPPANVNVALSPANHDVDLPVSPERMEKLNSCIGGSSFGSNADDTEYGWTPKDVSDIDRINELMREVCSVSKTRKGDEDKKDEVAERDTQNTNSNENIEASTNAATTTDSTDATGTTNTNNSETSTSERAASEKCTTNSEPEPQPDQMEHSKAILSQRWDRIHARWQGAGEKNRKEREREEKQKRENINKGYIPSWKAAREKAEKAKADQLNVIDLSRVCASIVADCYTTQKYARSGIPSPESIAAQRQRENEREKARLLREAEHLNELLVRRKECHVWKSAAKARAAAHERQLRWSDRGLKLEAESDRALDGGRKDWFKSSAKQRILEYARHGGRPMVQHSKLAGGGGWVFCGSDAEPITEHKSPSPSRKRKTDPDSISWIPIMTGFANEVARTPESSPRVEKSEENSPPKNLKASSNGKANTKKSKPPRPNDYLSLPIPSPPLRAKRASPKLKQSPKNLTASSNGKANAKKSKPPSRNDYASLPIPNPPSRSKSVSPELKQSPKNLKASSNGKANTKKSISPSHTFLNLDIPNPPSRAKIVSPKLKQSDSPGKLNQSPGGEGKNERRSPSSRSPLREGAHEASSPASRSPQRRGFSEFSPKRRGKKKLSSKGPGHADKHQTESELNHQIEGVNNSNTHSENTPSPSKFQNLKNIGQKLLHTVKASRQTISSAKSYCDNKLRTLRQERALNTKFNPVGSQQPESGMLSSWFKTPIADPELVKEAESEKVNRFPYRNFYGKKADFVLCTRQNAEKEFQVQVSKSVEDANVEGLGLDLQIARRQDSSLIMSEMSKRSWGEQAVTEYGSVVEVGTGSVDMSVDTGEFGSLDDLISAWDRPRKKMGGKKGEQIRERKEDSERRIVRHVLGMKFYIDEKEFRKYDAKTGKTITTMRSDGRTGRFCPCTYSDYIAKGEGDRPLMDWIDDGPRGSGYYQQECVEFDDKEWEEWDRNDVIDDVGKEGRTEVAKESEGGKEEGGKEVGAQQGAGKEEVVGENSLNPEDAEESKQEPNPTVASKKRKKRLRQKLKKQQKNDKSDKNDQERSDKQEEAVVEKQSEEVVDCAQQEQQHEQKQAQLPKQPEKEIVDCDWFCDWQPERLSDGEHQHADSDPSGDDNSADNGDEGSKGNGSGSENGSKNGNATQGNATEVMDVDWFQGLYSENSGGENNGGSEDNNANKESGDKKSGNTNSVDNNDKVLNSDKNKNASSNANKNDANNMNDDDDSDEDLELLRNGNSGGITMSSPSEEWRSGSVEEGVHNTVDASKFVPGSPNFDWEAYNENALRDFGGKNGRLKLRWSEIGEIQIGTKMTCRFIFVLNTLSLF